MYYKLLETVTENTFDSVDYIRYPDYILKEDDVHASSG